MAKTRDNHYVAQWHQKGFMHARDTQLCHLTRREIDLKNGDTKTVLSKKWHTTAQKFYGRDLYSTFFGDEVNDEIEQKLFGPIDDTGSKAIRAFLTDDQSQWHTNFEDLFIYIDAQKLRTPKGLDWIKGKYPELSQIQLMMEMQALRSMHCTLWAEGVRELVSAEDSDVKFIISDHPVTVYNHACPPDTDLCRYPNDPDISLKGSQTIFPLDKNRCLILTNLEYAQDPAAANPLQQRTNATRIRRSMVKTIEFIATRNLTAGEVTKINHVIKSRARSSVAAGKEEWLYPENGVTCDWADIRHVLLPPTEELYRFGGETFAQFKDGSVHYQDAFGRTTPPNDYLKKTVNEAQISSNEPCGCGSGRKYKSCCRNLPVDLRMTWDVASIRDRNLAFCNCIRDVLGLNRGKTWVDVRRELSDDQISKIYGFYSVLWPRETDIYSLLPKSDGKFRGLYTGILDVRVIRAIALPIASAFDDFLIETPVTNPNNVNPEFSPTKSPASFKYQALKEFLFMLEIEPFIGLGLVNLVPDPCEFDLDLRWAMMKIAKDRGWDRNIISEQERHLCFQLMNEDLLNSMSMMPIKARIHAASRLFGLTIEEATRAISALEQNAEASPLMMLQQTSGGKSSQLLPYKMGPNYEMGLFLAQVTGSVLVTDSGLRWRQLAKAQHREQGMASYPWSVALDQLNKAPIDYQFVDTLKKSQGQFELFRNLMRTANRMVLENDRDAAKLNRIAGQATELVNQISLRENPPETTTLKILSPDGGFYDTQVQRLLTRSSCTKYDQLVRSVYGFGLQG